MTSTHKRGRPTKDEAARREKERIEAMRTQVEIYDSRHGKKPKVVPSVTQPMDLQSTLAGMASVFGENLVRATPDDDGPTEEMDVRGLMQRQTELMEDMKEYLRVSMDAILAFTRQPQQQQQQRLPTSEFQIDAKTNTELTHEEREEQKQQQSTGGESINGLQGAGAGTDLLAFMGLQAEQGK